MLKRIASYGFLGLFLCTMLWVSFAAAIGVAQPLQNVCVVAALLCVFFTLLYHFVLQHADALHPQTFHRLTGGLLLFFIGIATILGCYTMTYPVSDLAVLCEAVAYWVANGDILPYSFYFTICANTLGNCIFLYFIFKPLSFIGLTMGGTLAECIAIFANVLMVALAVFCMLRISARVLKRQGQQLLFLLLSISFAPFYLWAHRYYSDTLAMPFAPLAVLLYLRATETTHRAKQAAYGTGIGLCLWVGYFIKGNVLIALPALLIFATFTLPWRKLLCIFIPLLLSLCLCFASWNIYRHHNSWITYENEAYDKFPATMWLLYGAHGTGNYADEDVTYLKSFATYEERSVAAKEKLLEYYSVYTPKTYLEFLTTKFSTTWANGKYDAEHYLVASRSGNWTHYFLMEGMPFYALTNYYCNGWHFAFLGMLLLSTAAALLRPQWDASFLLRICTFGLLVFLCFWETKSRYLVSFTPFFPLFFAQGTLCLSAALHKGLQITGLAPQPLANDAAPSTTNAPATDEDDTTPYTSAS